MNRLPYKEWLGGWNCFRLYWSYSNCRVITKASDHVVFFFQQFYNPPPPLLAGVYFPIFLHNKIHVSLFASGWNPLLGHWPWRHPRGWRSMPEWETLWHTAGKTSSYSPQKERWVCCRLSKCVFWYVRRKMHKGPDKNSFPYKGATQCHTAGVFVCVFQLRDSSVLGVLH